MKFHCAEPTPVAWNQHLISHSEFNNAAQSHRKGGLVYSAAHGSISLESGNIHERV